MENYDPFIKERNLYNSTLEQYNSIIVKSFDPIDFKNYNEVLFSAHSCGIEGNSFTVDETRALKEKGFGFKLQNKSLAEAFEILDHFNASTYLLNNKDSDLSENLLKETHRILTLNTLPYKGHVPGEYSKTQMGAGDTIFKDTMKAIANMPKLMTNYDRYIKQNEIHPLELSAMFHQQFIYSHPFPDGNGRLGRLLSNFILNKFDHPPVIILKENREAYIDALKASEKHNNKTPTISFFYNTSISRMNNEIAQKKNLLKNYHIGLIKNNVVPISTLETGHNNIILALNFHLNNDYKGKIANIKFDGVNGALNKALKSNFGVSLSKEELNSVDSLTQQQSNSKGSSRSR